MINHTINHNAMKQNILEDNWSKTLMRQWSLFVQQTGIYRLEIGANTIIPVKKNRDFEYATTAQFHRAAKQTNFLSMKLLLR